MKAPQQRGQTAPARKRAAAKMAPDSPAGDDPQAGKIIDLETGEVMPRDLIETDAIYVGECPSGTLWYRELREVKDDVTGEITVIPAPGICLRERKGGRVRVLLDGHIEVVSSTANDDSARARALVELDVMPHNTLPVMRIKVTREKALHATSTCWEVLTGRVEQMPTSRTDKEAIFQAILALVRHAQEREKQRSQTDRAYRPRHIARVMRDQLGWVEYAGRLWWPRVNGALCQDGVFLDHEAPLFADVNGITANRFPDHRLGDAPYPDEPDVAALSAFLHFYDAIYPQVTLAMLGGAAHVSLPYLEQDGRARWVLELFAPTGMAKTAHINHMLAMFSGAGYHYGTTTNITDSRTHRDSGVGLTNLLSYLRGTPYTDIDYRAKFDPSDPDYIALQKRRIDLNNEAGNTVGGGVVGLRGDSGGSRVRPAPSGFMIRAGEQSPHLYSVAHDEESSDARACTFIFPGISDPDGTALSQIKREQLRRSVDVERRVHHLGAIGVLWYRWLASFDRATFLTLYQETRAQTAQEVAHERISDAYAHIANERVCEQLTDIITGLRIFLRFLSDPSRGGIIASAPGRPVRFADAEPVREVITAITDLIPTLISDRLQMAEDLALKYIAQRGGASAEQSIARQIVDALTQALLTGRVHFMDDNNNMPNFDALCNGDIYALGWKPSTRQDMPDVPSGYTLGWIDEQARQMMIAPERFRAFLQNALPHCPNDLDCKKALAESGILVTERRGKGDPRLNYVIQKHRNDGSRQRWIVLNVDRVIGRDAEDDPPGDPQEPQTPASTNTPIAPVPVPTPASAPAPMATPAPIQEDVPLSDDARRYLDKVGDPWNEVPPLRRAIIHYAAIGSPLFTLEIGGKAYPCRGDLLFDRIRWLFRQGATNHHQTGLIDYATRCIKTLGTLAPAPHEREETEMTSHA